LVVSEEHRQWIGASTHRFAIHYIPLATLPFQLINLDNSTYLADVTMMVRKETKTTTTTHQNILKKTKTKIIRVLCVLLLLYAIAKYTER
jgi:hypothetical protein